MLVLHTVPPAENLSVHLVNSITSLCDLHLIPRGNPLNLGAFLRALSEDRHLAMDFWRAVARASDESPGLALVEMNGVVLEAVITTVTGRSIAQMIAAGGDQRRWVGELGSLLAGEDADGPFADPMVKGVQIEDRPSLVDAERLDVENLRADVERLKAAFESRFGAESARFAAQGPTPGSEAMAAPTAISTESTREAPAAVPEQDDVPEQVAELSKADAVPLRVVAHHHFVYAEARALSRGDRMEWVDQAGACLPVTAETFPFAPSSTERAGVPARPEGLEGSGRDSVNGVNVPAAATAQSVINVESPGEQRERSRRRIGVLLLSAVLLMFFAGSVAYLRYWPGRSSAARVAGGKGVSATGGLSARLAEVSAAAESNLSLSAVSGPAIAAAPAAVHAPASIPVRWVPEASFNRDGSQVRQSVIEASDPPKIAINRNERITPPPVMNVAGPETRTASEVMAALVNSAPNPPTQQTRTVPVIDRERAASAPVAISSLKGSSPPSANVRASASPAVEKAGAPQRISSGVMTAAKISGVAPRYPLIAKASHVSGAVVLDAVISKTGLVEDVQVVSGPNVLRRSAVDAVKTWKYKPSLLNGEPVKVGTVIVVNFREGQ